MSNLVDKIKTLYKDQILTTTLAKTGAILEIDVEGYDKLTIYPEYTPSTVGNKLRTQLFFNNRENKSGQAGDVAEEGLLSHPEPHEVIAADGTATIVQKIRHYVCLTATEEAAPPISMPVSDKKVELFIAEDLDGGGVHGTLTVTYRLSRLGE